MAANRHLCLIAIVLIINVLLYGYPFFRGVSHLIWRPTLRMLLLADPHLEGDSKIARMGWRGRLDIWGNDHYLGHIHRSMRFFTKPTHTVILGDHMSSQWIDDVEFTKRSIRMEQRILKWGPRDAVFNVTGNHDIGYAGDMTQFRVNRWQDRWGPTNYVVEISSANLPRHALPLRIVSINDLHLDGPALDENLRGQTHAFLRSIPRSCNETEETPGCFTGATILLTHVPLFKEAGVCVDGPHMAYYEGPRILLREQNHLSPESTKVVLEQVLGSGHGIVLTGHDHEGCHVVHIPGSGTSAYWQAKPFNAKLPLQRHQPGSTTAVEEVTVRSVMGQYGGNTGLLTASFDHGLKRWQFHYQAVPFVHNTIWWVCHVITILVSTYLVMTYAMSKTTRGSQALQKLKKAIRNQGLNKESAVKGKKFRSR